MPYKDKDKYRECARKATAKWRLNNPEKVAAQQARRYRKNPTAEVARTQNWFRARKYGITSTEFEALVAASGGHCQLCGDPFTRTPHIDHNHSTGEVRGLLCSPCNVGLGFFRDNTNRLKLAIQWIENGGPAEGKQWLS